MIFTRTCVATVAFLVLAGTADGAITPEQRSELVEISKQVNEASKLLREKRPDEAEKAVEEAEERLEALLESGVPETERLVQTIQRNVALRRRAIALQRGERPKGVSFSDDVAPIIEERCLSCHGPNNPRGGLQLDTFAGWRRGGASRQRLLNVLMPRLTAPPPLRMPKGEQPLTQTQLQTIARWIQEGAPFDGRDENSRIGEKKEENETAPMIAKATGDETVSFLKDVAPFVVNICGQCHAGNNPRGGFNMTTFEGIMKGGESGPVIEPGDPESSRLWLMVSNQEQPRMPPGQLRITRSDYDALTTWIREGAKFDGDNPRTLLSELIPTQGEMRAAELAKLSAEEFVAHRRTKSDAQWKRAFPREQANRVETEQYLVYGSVSEDRLKQIAAWADEQVAFLETLFGARDERLWKGKLAIFLANDRFAYEEFASAVNGRLQVPREVHGHVVVSPDYEDAYLVIEDIGDEASEESPGLKAHLANHVAQAYLERGGTRLPDWALQGAGLYAAGKSSPGNTYFVRLTTQAGAALQGARLDRLFEDGTFSPAQSSAVGYAIVEFLVQSAGPAKFLQFMNQLGRNGDVAAAMRSAYGRTPADVAVAFRQNLDLKLGR